MLRVYWLALISGHVEGYPNDDTLPCLVDAARRLQEMTREDTQRLTGD